MDRRDFFGIIAAPLLRTFVPPVPLCGSVVPDGTAYFRDMPHPVRSGDVLTADNLRMALDVLRQQQSGRIILHPTHIHILERMR